MVQPSPVNLYAVSVLSMSTRSEPSRTSRGQETCGSSSKATRVGLGQSRAKSHDVKLTKAN